jgi:hypothetical protein
MLEAECTPEPSAAGRIRYVFKFYDSHSSGNEVYSLNQHIIYNSCGNRFEYKFNMSIILSLCLTIEDICGSGCIDPCILVLGTTSK